MMRTSVPPAAAVRKAGSLAGKTLCRVPSSEQRNGAGEAAQAQMRHRALEDRQVGGGLEALTLVSAQARGQVSTAQRRGDDHLLDDGGLGASLVTTELKPGIVVSTHEDGADKTDRDQAREDVQREQSGTPSAPLTTGHLSLRHEKQPGRVSRRTGRWWLRL